MTKKHVMIDIETLGTTQEAVILSIGATCFNLETGATNWPLQPFYKRVQPTSQPDRKIDAATVEWWFKQSTAAREALTNGETCTLQIALKALEVWLANFNVKELVVWANGVTFDIGILEHAYRQLGMRPPWHYGGVACMRTFKNVVPPELAKEVPAVGEAHNALDDAVWQANYVMEAMRWLRRP